MDPVAYIQWESLKAEDLGGVFQVDFVEEAQDVEQEQGAGVACIWCTRVATASVVLWWGQDLNCDMGRRLANLILWFTHLVTIFSMSLPIHSRRLMGQYAFT